MIYVLFGPPGVGKTYIGQLLSRSFDLPFFDADTLIDSEERQLLQSGEYDQSARDRFVSKLINHVETLIVDHGRVQDLVVAEAFTKEKNRIEFMKKFPNNVCYIMINTPVEVAKSRAKKRLDSGHHVINNVALELIWKEFEQPRLLYMSLNNYEVVDRELVIQFRNLLKLLRKGRSI
ncbi:MAG: AAA family ATPase [bacterium]